MCDLWIYSGNSSSDIFAANFSYCQVETLLFNTVPFAFTVLIVHTALNHRYGFHRDELQVVDDARYLDWGYVVYPPLTPAIARFALELFGPSLRGLRFFSALSQIQ